MPCHASTGAQTRCWCRSWRSVRASNTPWRGAALVRQKMRKAFDCQHSESCIDAGGDRQAPDARRRGTLAFATSRPASSNSGLSSPIFSSLSISHSGSPFGPATMEPRSTQRSGTVPATDSTVGEVHPISVLRNWPQAR